MWFLSLLLAILASLHASSGLDQVPLRPLSSDPAPRSPPNIVLILTDDQDLRLGSLDYQPLLKKYLRDHGTTFSNHFCTIALCCPSRVSLWTGKAAHNTNVTDVSSPYGGYRKFVSQGLNDNYLPVWLRNAGYNTYYTGKLLNEHTVDNYNDPFPKGFSGSDFLLDPFTYQYLNSSFQRNREPPTYHPGEYSTDLIAEKAYGFLDEAVKDRKPFFLGIAPPACHSNVEMEGEGKAGLRFTAPIPAKRHQDLFKNAHVPRTRNFNPDQPSGASWIKYLPRQSQENIQYNDHFHRQRLRALQAVDEIVEGVVQQLEAYGILDDTYIIYTTDNGYHIGQHRLQPGKTCGFEEDINIPLIVRGPGVPKNHTTDIVTTHTDLAPTIFDIIGLSPREDFDGVAIPLNVDDLARAEGKRHEHVNVEYWGFSLAEGNFGDRFTWNNTCKAVRVIAKEYNLYYSVWCNNEHELYDIMHDPGQMDNLMNDTPSGKAYSGRNLMGLPVTKIAARLDALLMVLKSCKGQVCVRPWAALHPDGAVASLLEALSPKYDQLYEAEQQKVSFNRCENGYILDAEGPQFEQHGWFYRDGHSWDNWV
ncbi:Arylsulfatase [Neonectria ditissima]|uniref:Arylsulfatase n=1 Tax=Neonectria ditissima TaxID=78410 RepID=A0A0N8H805_9HYPO|nr:Arylsulfatase [Neonectria ditissima]